MLQFGDNFNRADSSSVGGSWTETDSNGVLSISGNKLRMNKSADNNGYIRYSKSLTPPIIISGTLEIITLNSTSLISIGILGGGTAENPFRDLFGFAFLPRSSGTGVQLLDTTPEGSMTSFTLTAGHTYNFELIILADYSRQLRVWEVGSARPSSATVSGNAKTPTADGTNIQIGYDNGGTGAADHKLDYFRILSAIKSIIGLDTGSIKSINGLEFESIKTFNGL